MNRILTILLLSLSASLMQAQIKIGGNVYGGGNKGDVDGSTSVTVRSGDLNEVYGGARMADVKGNAFVNIDGERTSSYILINRVYGGNDISGKIGASKDRKVLPEALTLEGENKVNASWDAFVRVSSSKTVATTEGTETKDSVYIGQLFGGGNGEYDLVQPSADNNNTYQIKDKKTGEVIASNKEGFTPPSLGKTYLEVVGGSIVYAYGGGNNATVTDSTVICVDNPSSVVNSMTDKTGTELLTNQRFKDMGINIGFSYPSSDAFQIGRFFGGNNMSEMAIRPIWNLKSGKIRNLYSGGNKGAMTCPEGLLLNIEKTSTIIVDNLYGGCRMADVIPTVNGVYTPTTNKFEGYNFPLGFAARVVIRGGDVNNVYGGNDVSGKVYGGNAVGISTSVRGDVYGGGNGSYPYTDKLAFKGHDIYGDLYYEPGSNSIEALNAFRPNAEQVSVHVGGTEDKPTVIHGGIYCGGNSATIMTDMANPKVELKIGSYVYADSVFLGNNGANMVKKDILEHYAGNVDDDGNVVTTGGTDFSSLDLTDEKTFNTYMDAVAMRLLPSVVFEKADNGDGQDYIDYTSYFGSFFCGGNVGSMRVKGKVTINFDKPFYIYNKVVGGCNNANIYTTSLNHEYLGGFIGEPEAETGNKLELNFAGLKIFPKRWKYNDDGSFALDSKGNPQLEWNTFIGDTQVSTPESLTFTAEDKERRLKGGNIYGGCYNSGHINGNVTININETLLERDKIFDETDEGDILYENTEKEAYTIKKRNSGVILSEQGMDVLGSALNVFGGGFGGDSEIWGSTTINLNKGYVFQIFGGGEAGAIGNAVSSTPDPNNPNAHILKYEYNEKYSTYINVNGTVPGVARGAKGDSDDMAECEFIYGGAFEGPIAGNTHINLGNGRVFNTFAGSCNADILGHTETYVGRKLKADGTYEYGGGFPWIRDHIYGGNDLGGSILGKGNFLGQIRDEVKDMVDDTYKEQAKNVSAYMEYTQGRVRNILGGCFGDYDYTDPAYEVGEGKPVANKPYLHHAFVNIRPNTNASNSIEKVFGAGEGYPGDRDGDMLQDHSYVLIDIPDGVENYANTEIFGAGAYDGLGMRWTPDETFAENFDLSEASAIIDLMRGKVSAAYGGSYEEGITRRTMVNVPEESSIHIKNIFGGAYGRYILPPCDVYESNVNYCNTSEKARVTGAIYGGNNNVRRTLYSHINISSPVWSSKDDGYLAKIYGAGKGVDTWSEYTEVNLEDGAKVYEVYGGGEMGHVLNAESVQKYMQMFREQPSPDILAEDLNWSDKSKWKDGIVGGELKDADTKEAWLEVWKDAWTVGDYYDPLGEFSRYTGNKLMTLENEHLVRPAEIDDRNHSGLSDALKARLDHKYNTNVIIKKGATVTNYAYGGGYGDTKVAMSGDVYGSTYIALLGGTVRKDIYAAGTAGSVDNLFGADGFTATANAYIQGGSVRNVYGGGWRGSVGYNADYTSTTGDILGDSHVVVGKRGGGTYLNGVPAVKRNVYGGGEGGGIFGTAYVTINDGYIGYRYEDGKYVEELDETTKGDNMLDRSGNVFGGGYVANSYVDISDVKMYGGTVRGSLYGGGEIGPIGRGTVKSGAPAGVLTNGDAKIYKPGEAHVTMYKGRVLRNVFGGGRGKDNWGGEGYMTDEEKATMDLSSKGYVFGKTDVNIHGGSIGSVDGVAKGYGNIFGGGDLGFVYSGSGTKGSDGYYHDANKNLTEDCRVSVKVLGYATQDVTIDGKSYAKGDTISNETLDKLANGDAAWKSVDQEGITVHNGVFAGGNVSSGSNEVFAFSTTVFGNATAAVVDVFCRDLVSVGGDGIGGIYGDGNLTYVDGYRELNISNYGTDFYALPSSMDLTDPETMAQYNKLTDRQKAIYVVKYKFDGEAEGNYKGLYEAGDVVLSEEYNKFTDVQKKHWTAVHSVINEGRYINTIQRCDFCGIIGSRLVLRGAMDRAQENTLEQADFTNYTINRVGELSLNQWHSLGDGVPGDVTHGCYFGIYNVVKLLGAVTSDVKFDDVRETASTLENNKVDGKTYWQWKEAKKQDNNVNNGSSWNKIALASGVFLEIVKDIKDNGDKVYGPITGIVELDLLNVTPGEGGGYVYAENVHGNRSSDEAKAIAAVLSDANKAQGGCRTNAGYTYSEPGTLDELETSGNFVSSLKDIVDDCFPTSKSWVAPGAAPAHYWYIRGEFYVYDQEVSAYTGSADAYSAEISIPLTMVAQSNARLRILNVLPGLYADPSQFDPAKSYFDEELNTWKSDSLEIVYDNVTKRFGQNDPISYWDWYMTNKANQSRFVTETYSCNEQITVNGVTYYPGQGILPAVYNSLKDQPGVDAWGGAVANAQEKFGKTNGMSHDNGYVLTLDMTNPSKWNDYYTALNNSGTRISAYQWSKLSDDQKKNYVESATFRCNATGTYGQYYFSEGDVISQAVYDMETSDVSVNASKTQASFERAYIAVDSCEVTLGGELRIMQRNVTISAGDYNSLSAADKKHFTLGKVCGSTFSVNDKELYILGQVVPASSSITTGAYAANFTDAWYCTAEGSWGGQYYEEGENYSGVKYCQLLPEERKNFSYNYDALDLMVANFTQDGENYPDVEQLARAGTDRNNYMGLYDGTNAEKLYSIPVHIDYNATYKGSENFTYKDDNGTEVRISNGTKLESEDYQNLPNDFAHYSTIHVNDNHRITDTSDPDYGKYVVYVVWNTFDVGGVMYNAGKVITKTDYDGLGSQSLRDNVDKVVMTSAQQKSSPTGVFYYCIDEYTVGEKDKYVVGYSSPTLTDIDDEDYGIGKKVEVGTIISSTKMNAPNKQMGFEVSGDIPTEQTTLYVPVSADYNELQKDRYITVIFEYTYTESDAQGLNFETRVEKHILNLRIRFKSGKPVIGKLKEPGYVLPLETIDIGIPFIQESANAFPILKGGFEIYNNETDALKHRNGREFTSGTEPVYFYQDMNYVAYYAETRMGRTFSDPVPIHVANYQRMSDVITDPEHMYINHRLVKRNPKIYIDNRTVSGSDYNELDAMKEMFDIVNSDYGRLADDNTEKNHGRDILGAKGLDFFVQDDVTASRPWTPVGTEANCFQGNFHGNGHTLSNMSASLFGKLCGNVYNTGVMGSFTGGGIADTGGGRIENCWVSTTATPTGKPVIATPGDATIINCYYPENQSFTAHTEGIDVTRRPVADFVNGRVAYDLNRFYLEARYNLFTLDGNVNGNPVKNDSALFLMPDGTVEMATAADGKQYPVPHGLYYTSDYACYPGNGGYKGYVEKYYEDGDFRFADGLKPQTADLRLSQNAGYLPVFPDDYIFFGQRLTYDLYGNKQHDEVPMGIVKDHTFTNEMDSIDNSRNGLINGKVATENRVYRAPAYFRNGILGKTAMFNAHAAFTDTYNGMDVYKNMTAIDFSGGNGDTNGSQGVVPGAKSDFTAKAKGYGPRLDFVRLDSIRTSGLTQNLLAYAPDPAIANTMNAYTAERLTYWANELTYAEDETNPHYRAVAVQDDTDVHGHMVQKNGDTYQSLTDHFLVDRQDFNAPMAYTMGAGHRMWYQREPDNYVEKDKGWEAVSLPFSAEIVTTQDKGEITHFYKGSDTGHEYWLRQYTGGNMLNDNTTFLAKMNKLDVGNNSKEYTNTFLWDYYYSKDSQWDKNSDKYQKYYSESHTYYSYPYLSGGTPYIIGFPGDYYYEFDLSGSWVPANRFNNGIIDSPGQQTVTFASKTGAPIDVSDTEMTKGKSTADGYTFLPNYLAQEIDANMGYLLDNVGGSFKKSGTAVTAVPFRPYFIAGNNARTRGIAEQIIFGSDDSTIGDEKKDPRDEKIYGTLKIYPAKHKIIVESSLSYTTDVRILTPAGVTLKTFTIEPGQTVETYIVNQGVYIVQSADSHYIKKLTVR